MPRNCKSKDLLNLLEGEANAEKTLENKCFILGGAFYISQGSNVPMEKGQSGPDGGVLQESRHPSKKKKTRDAVEVLSKWGGMVPDSIDTLLGVERTPETWGGQEK